jgi:hypothetical protein
MVWPRVRPVRSDEHASRRNGCSALPRPSNSHPDARRQNILDRHPQVSNSLSEAGGDGHLLGEF